MLCKHSATYQMEHLTEVSKAAMMASMSVSSMAAAKAYLTEELKAAMMALSLMSKKASCSE